MSSSPMSSNPNQPPASSSDPAALGATGGENPANERSGLSRFIARVAGSENGVEGRLGKLSLGGHLAAVGGSFVALGVVNTILDRLYAASNHPVSYAEGQTSFDAEAVEGWYGIMSSAGTLDVYVYTQLFDYLFMMAFALFGLALASLLRRAHAPHQGLMTASRFGGVAIAVGLAFDAIENLISFVMLGFYSASTPAGFPDWLVYPYSAVAVIKFVLIVVGIVLLVMALIALIVRVLARLAGGGASRRAARIG